MQKIMVMAGLPGSGKSHLANRLYDETPRNAYIWDIDKYAGSRKVWQNGKYVIESKLTDFFRGINYDWFDFNKHILDGLFLTNKDYAGLIENLMKIDKIKNSQMIFEFYFFKPDIETCLWNDQSRDRDKKATVSIRNATVERPDLSILTQLTEHRIKIIDCTSERIDEFDANYLKFKRQHKLENMWEEDILRSDDSWSKGGTYCDYEGECYQISEKDDLELEPRNFPEFVDLLEKVIPQIDDALLKELFDATVSYYEYEIDDYYGGSDNRKCFQCDLKKLFELLEENELILMGKLLNDL